MSKRWIDKIRKVCVLSGLMAAAMMLSSCSGAARGKQTDLNAFYEISSSEEYVVLLDGENIGKGFKSGQEIYLPYTLVHEQINDKFYLDRERQQILYTTPTAIESVEIGADTKTMAKTDDAYLALSYVKERTEVDCQTYENPNRVEIGTMFGEVSVVKPLRDTVIRQYDKSDADYMAKVSKGESLIVKEKKSENWYRVLKDNGIIGYISADQIGKVKTETRTCEKKLEEYSHIVMDDTVCMGWHQMEGTGGNATLNEVTDSCEGILNVISPTWFKLTDTQGNISSSAQSSYVDTAHAKGMKVWALADDFSYGEDGTYYVASVLAHYDTRQALINNLVNEVKNSGADGLNIDYEKIYEEIADDYVEFIRELSIACRQNQLVLSVDTYVEQDYNTFFNRKAIGEAADYLVIMGYDEHWAGGNMAGSVASLPYVKQGIDRAVAVTDAKRVINGVPFFTRIWVETPEGQTNEGTFVQDAANGNYWLTSSAVAMETAEQALQQNGVQTTWLDDLGQYYGEYKTGEVCTRIWLEEERSIGAKLDYMSGAGIGGVACWKLGLEKPAVWQEIAEYAGK